MMEEPWISRPDVENEVIRRSSLLARVPHHHLVVAGCSDKSSDLMMSRFPRQYTKNSVIQIREYKQLCTELEPLLHHQRRRHTEVPWISYEELNSLSATDQLAVIEQSESIGRIIAENFCIANGYRILGIEASSQELVNDCENLMRQWNCADDAILRNRARDELFGLLRARTRDLERSVLRRIVFFTKGVPYGVLPFRSPVAHLFLERDLGLQILRHYVRAFEEDRGIAIALICDPGLVPESESVTIEDTLRASGVEILDLIGKRASSFRFMHLLEWYPYDLAVISSHAGEVRGRRVTEDFGSSKGHEYRVVYDLYSSLAPVPGGDEVIVQEMTVPVAVNGIPWGSKDKMREDEQLAAFDLHEFNCRDRKNRRILKIQDREGIKFSNALQLWKRSWIPVLHVLGETRFPVIFNNACSSWMEFAGRFVFAGALAYIGTTKDISNSLASSCGSRFIELAVKRRSMLYALFQAQEQYIEQLGYTPYLYFGHPDASLRPTYSDNKAIRRRRVRSATRYWQTKLNRHKDEDEKKKVGAILTCLTEAG